MSPFGVPEGIAAGAALLGLGGQVHANATNVKLAREQMRFQERMSSTAVQRHRRDLEAAGYNPMLGVAGGAAGASTPVGASPRVENAPVAGITSALGARHMAAQVELLRAQTGREQASGMLLQQQRLDLEGGDLAGVQAKAHGRLLNLNADTVEKLLPLVAQHMSAQTARELASALQARDHASLLRAETILKEFEQQHAKNLSEAEKSLYFRKIAPYVHSAGEVVGIAGRVATPIAIGRGARALQSRRGVPVPAGASGNLMPRGSPIIDRTTGKVLGTRRD